MKIGGKTMQTDLILCLVLIVGWSRRTSAVDEKEGSLSSLFPHSDRAVGPGEELEKQEKIDKRPDEQALSPKIPQQPQSEKVTMEAAREHYLLRFHDMCNVLLNESGRGFGEHVSSDIHAT